MANREGSDISNDVNLEREFARIGFDYKIILKSVRYVNNWIIQMSAEEIFSGFTKDEGKKIYFFFSVIRSGTRHEFLIQRIEATLIATLPNSSQTKIVASKSYWNYNEPFPTKERMCDDISYALNINVVQEKARGYKVYLN